MELENVHAVGDLLQLPQLLYEQQGDPALEGMGKGSVESDAVAAAGVDVVAAGAVVRPGTWLGTHSDMMSCCDVAAGDGETGEDLPSPLHHCSSQLLMELAEMMEMLVAVVPLDEYDV